MTGWLFNFLFVSQAGLYVGGFLFAAPLFAAAAVLGWKCRGQLTMGPDPVIPTPDEADTHVIPTVPIAPNYTPTTRLDESYPLAGEVLPRSDDQVTAQLTAVAAYFERIETVTVTRSVVVSHRQFDPLDSDVPTVELPQYTTDTPLFFVSRPPKPFELEGFTRGWNTDQLARAIAAGRPQAARAEQ